jgi:predicted amidohydrolase YtcJ
MRASRLYSRAIETAFLHGRIHTMDPAHPTATGLVARDGRVVSVGDAEQLAAGLAAGADVVDLGGRVVLPGFVDAHCHLELSTCHLSYAVQCFAPPLDGLDAICAAMAERARTTARGEWVVGRANFNLERWVPEARPLLRRDLDTVLPDHPAVVMSGLHVCTLNTRALEVTGLLSGDPGPRGSSIDLERGRATELWDWLPLPQYERSAIAGAVSGLGRALFTERGVTSIAELPFTREGVHALQELRRRGELPARLRLWYHVPRLGGVGAIAALGLETGFGDPWLSIGGVKLFVDGAGVDVHGTALSDLKWTQPELDEVVWQTHRAGLQVWMHVAPTREAAEMALSALETAQRRLPRPDHRHRIEHVGDMRPDRALLDRLKAVGAVPVCTPQFVYSYGDADPEGSCSPLRTLHAMGFRVPGNSDSTGTQPEAANPFHGIWCALSHRTRGGAVVAPGERIDLDAAFRMFTADAAWACHMDDRGVLREGALADLVVLGADPWEVAVDELPALPVDMTVLGGTIVHRR